MKQYHKPVFEELDIDCIIDNIANSDSQTETEVPWPEGWD